MANFASYSDSVRVVPDVFNYDSLSPEIKIEINHIWNRFFFQAGIPEQQRDRIFEEMGQKVMEVYPLEYLPSTWYVSSILEKIYIHFKSIKNVAKALDVVQVVSLYMECTENFLSRSVDFFRELDYSGKEAVQDINTRFKINSIGYQYEGGKIVKLSNNVLHDGTVRQTLSLVALPEYETVNTAFLEAHDHYKSGGEKMRDCLTRCTEANSMAIR